MRKLDSKHHIDDQLRVVKTSNNLPIPDDEPVFLFRARDKFALPALEHYRKLCVEDGCTPHQFEHLDFMLSQFRDFAATRPKRMKQPGVTSGR
jgi:hypothetical protein